jgi:hypothetical protein
MAYDNYSPPNLDTAPELGGIPARDTSYADTLSLPSLTGKEILKSFGREEDYVEIHILNASNQLIYTEPYYTDYTTVEEVPGKITGLNIDFEQLLKNRNYTTGKYKVKVNILRNKVFNTSYFPFHIKEISPTRREIKSISTDVNNQLFDVSIESFILEIEGASYFKEFSLNFGDGKIIPAINLLLNTDTLKHELILKTLNPLPEGIVIDSKFKIVEEITDPFIVDIDLGDPELEDDSIQLLGPNFQINTRQNNSVPSDLKSYDDILQYSVTSSYNRLLNKLENPDTLNIHYDFIRNVSESMEELDRPYHFENFVHFSSATERLKNFKYKLKLIEEYNSSIEDTNNIEGALTSSQTLTDVIDKIETKKRNVIKGFDGYEQFLYYTEGSNTYTWPKYNTTPPFIPYSITSSQAKNWLGDSAGITPSYSGQMLSASYYDKQNPHNLNNLIPQHITENTDNNFYVSFVNMIAQHFDHIWTHIKHLSEINNLDNKFGISKELVYFQLKSLGIDAFDQFENANLIEYILGEGLVDNTVGKLPIGDYVVGGLSNKFYNMPPGTKTYITASNAGSIPKGDITKEIWKRLYNNAPLLLKTKGTERGIRALMACYGVPSTILNIKEYGGSTLTSGPLKDLQTADTYKTFSYEKSGMAIKGTSNQTGYFINSPWSSSKTDASEHNAKTVEFRIKPTNISDKQHLFSLSSSYENLDPHLILTNYAGTNDISASNDASDWGRLELWINGSSVANTNYFPVYNGSFWNIFIGAPSNTTEDIKFGAYQSNWLKHVSYVTKSYDGQSSDSRKKTFGATDGGGYGGGAAFAFFGGISPNPNSAYDNVDTLRYSGSLQEIKIHFGELLSHETLKKHTLEPFMYSGNTPSSSFDQVVLRLPLGSNDKEDSGSFHPDIKTNYLEYSGVQFNGIEEGFVIEDYHRKIKSNINTDSREWTEIIETHHLPTPDSVGASMTSEKVRIDQGSIPADNILVVNKKRETSTLDRQPPDYEDLGIHFSPSMEMNEDIIYTLGSFRLDDYIGNPLPSAQSSSVYEDLKNIKDFYFKKVNDRYNYWDYIKMIQNFDHTLFKIIENFTPAKSNLKTGLLIEPHYLERNKIPREVPIRSDGQTMVTGSHQTFEVQMQTLYKSNALYKFATSSQQTRRGFGYDRFPMAPGGKSASISEWEPGSYVISDNNFHPVTSSKTSERIERGTNVTIEVYDEYVNPIRNKTNAFGAIYANNAQPCQAPIKPFVKRVSGIGPNSYGIGAASIEGSFVIEDYQANGGGTGNPGINFSAIENGFMVENYVSPGYIGVGSATIGGPLSPGTFIVGFPGSLPQLSTDPNIYKTHESNVLLGNVMIGRRSKKYFKYNTFKV